jgi:hypothetical protein
MGARPRGEIEGRLGAPLWADVSCTFTKALSGPSLDPAMLM